MDLTEAQWAKLKPLLAPVEGVPGAGVFRYLTFTSSQIKNARWGVFSVCNHPATFSFGFGADHDCYMQICHVFPHLFGTGFQGHNSISGEGF